MGRIILSAVIGIVVSLQLSSLANAAGPEDVLVGTVKAALGKNQDAADWRGLEKLPGIQWAPLPPAMRQNCLPDGGCFTRQGTLTLGDRSLAVMASGARGFVSNLYFRGKAVPMGEEGILAALKRAGFATELARCPVQGTIGGTNWYRLKNASTNPGVLLVQSSCNGKPCEGYQLTLGADPVPLQPKQLALYSEQCSGRADARKPVSTSSPQEALAQTLVAYVRALSGGSSDWPALVKAVPGAQWTTKTPVKTDLSYKNDPNPFSLSGSLALAQRQFGLLASGTQAQPKVVYIEENQLHARGEDVLGLLRSQGLDVRLARCGPVYTESFNNWYAVTSASTKPVMLRQSLRLDGKQVQDSYELRLDNTLRKRDPRDRDPGVGGCR